MIFSSVTDFLFVFGSFHHDGAALTLYGKHHRLTPDGMPTLLGKHHLLTHEGLLTL